MDEQFLYQKMDTRREDGTINPVPDYLPENLNPEFEMRPYQTEALENFIWYFESKNCPHPTQVLFHMATGSGKTLIMAGLMLYLYKKGYRDFLFFVNLSNIVEKTKENFLNDQSTKFLFAKEIVIDGKLVKINQVSNFQETDKDAINICFTTTQALHMDLWFTKENHITTYDFDERKVVLISDEAHHLNVDTKKKLSKEEKDIEHSWEETVKNIYSSNEQNVLLEFTATCDLKNQAIKDAYEDKIIYNYPLSEFYSDKYSKDIITLRSNLSKLDRALQALILSQYRMKVFQDHRISIKPVVLFKEKNISENKKFLEEFSQMIRQLNGAEILRLRGITPQNEIMERAYKYFDNNGISPENLALELRDDFAEEHCILVDCKQSDQEKSQKMVILNSLEDSDNPYRAIFAVDMLNEGWDVLNLFDIVRLDEKTESGDKKVSSTTISDAQLIGRGARYCPFRINDEQPKFQRKYDDDVTNELRVCETLYYHCQNEQNYIKALKKALKEFGLDIDNKIEKEYVLKDTFKKDNIYTNGLIFLNDRVVDNNDNIYELDSSVRNKHYSYQDTTGASGFDIIMSDDEKSMNEDVRLNTTQITIKQIAEINYAIVNKALMKNPIYKFDNLKSYFPHLASTREFITDDNYLGSIKITIQSKENPPTIETLYNAVYYVLSRIANYISNIESTYHGTKEFQAKYIRDVFRDKTVNYTNPHDEGVGVSQNSSSVRNEWRIDLSTEDWYAYTDNYGTTEEKAFVAYFKNYVDDLKKVYSKIYLVRNEQEFHIYSIDEGRRFEPDYVLFLQKNKAVGYEQMQIFIEPKGTHLLDNDWWKEEFLLQMKEEAIPVKIFADDNEYKIWGLHFFNTEKRMEEFDSDFIDIIEEQ